MTSVEARVACCSDLPRQNPAILWNALLLKYTVSFASQCHLAFFFFSPFFFTDDVFVSTETARLAQEAQSSRCLKLGECPGKCSEKP